MSRKQRVQSQRRTALAGQLFRKLVQLSMVALIVWTALGTHWRNFKVAHNSRRIVAMLEGDEAGWLYGLNEDMLSMLGDSHTVSEGFLGAPWGMHFAGWSFTDPWSIPALMAGGHLPPLPMVLAALIPLLIAVVLGRAFCAWLCPARLVFELGGLVRQGLLRLDIPLGDVALPPVGLWVGAATTLFAASSGAAVFHFTLPYLAFGAAVFSAVLTGAVGVAGVAFGMMLLTDVLVAPGQICRSLCPTGALLGLAGRWAPWRLRKTSDDRIGRPCPTTCDLCQRACPYGLSPGKTPDFHNSGCDACGRCILVCPDARLSRSMELSR